MRDPSRQAREHSPENNEGYIFIIQEKVRRVNHLLHHFWTDVKAYIISSPFYVIWSDGTIMALFESYVR